MWRLNKNFSHTLSISMPLKKPSVCWLACTFIFLAQTPSLMSSVIVHNYSCYKHHAGIYFTSHLTNRHLKLNLHNKGGMVPILIIYSKSVLLDWTIKLVTQVKNLCVTCDPFLFFIPYNQPISKSSLLYFWDIFLVWSHIVTYTLFLWSKPPPSPA